MFRTPRMSSKNTLRRQNGHYQQTFRSRGRRAILDVFIVAALFFMGTLAVLPDISSKKSVSASKELDHAADELMQPVPIALQNLDYAADQPVAVPIPQHTPQVGSETYEVYELRSVAQQENSGYPSHLYALEMMKRQRRAEAKNRFPDLTDEQLDFFFGPETPEVTYNSSPQAVETHNEVTEDPSDWGQSEDEEFEEESAL